QSRATDRRGPRRVARAIAKASTVGRQKWCRGRCPASGPVPSTLDRGRPAAATPRRAPSALRARLRAADLWSAGQASAVARLQGRVHARAPPRRAKGVPAEREKAPREYTRYTGPPEMRK